MLFAFGFVVLVTCAVVHYISAGERARLVRGKRKLDMRLEGGLSDSAIKKTLRTDLRRVRRQWLIANASVFVIWLAALVLSVVFERLGWGVAATCADALTVIIPIAAILVMIGMEIYGYRLKKENEVPRMRTGGIPVVEETDDRRHRHRAERQPVSSKSRV